MSTCLQCFYRDLLCHCFSFGITQWRCPSCETPLGSRAKQDGCFRRCTVTELWGMLCFWEWTTRKLFKILSKKIGNCTSQNANRKRLNVMFINDVSSCGIPDWGKRSLNTILVTYVILCYSLRRRGGRASDMKRLWMPVVLQLKDKNALISVFRLDFHWFLESSLLARTSFLNQRLVTKLTPS